MVRAAREQGVDAVDLLEQDDKGEFMLHRVAPQAKHMVAGITQRLGMPICRTDEEGHMLHRLELPATHTAFKLASRPVFATFIHGNAEAAGAGFQQARRNRFRITRLHIAKLNAAEGAQTFLKESDSIARVGNGRSGGGNDAEIHDTATVHQITGCVNPFT